MSYPFIFIHFFTYDCQEENRWNGLNTAVFKWLGEKDSNLRNGSQSPNPLLYNYLILLNNFAYIKLAYVKITPLAVFPFQFRR